MTVSAEETLTRYLEEAVVRHSFKRLEIESADHSLPVIAAWKRKTLSMNRAVALVSLGNLSVHPGEFAKAIKKPVGKCIGYFPFFYELGLQLVLIGRGVLDKSSGLEQFLDSRSRSVTLQSIHLVDPAAGELIGHLPADDDMQAEISLPGWAKTIEFIGKIKNPFAGKIFLRGQSRLRYSAGAGSAAISVRTWGQTTTGPFIDAIEDGIDKFIHGKQ
jgi:hypothetical protein